MSDPPADPAPYGSPAPTRRGGLLDQLLAAHSENTPLIVIEWDRNSRVTRWNAQAECVFGWSAAEVLGKGLFEFRFLHDESVALARCMSSDGVTGHQPPRVVSVQNYTKSGALVWCEWYTSVPTDDTGRPVATLTMARDVTPFRTTAEALEQSRARVRAALDGAKMLAWDMDPIANRCETTADLTDFYGIPRGPDYGDPVVALGAIHPDDVRAVLAGRYHAIETGTPMRYEFRGRAQAPDGGPRWFATRGQVLRDEAGVPVRIVAVTTDITERKRAE